MPDELTDYAKELITRCPHLINLFADKINKMIGDWGLERLEPIQIDSSHLTCDIQDLLQHVGYTDEQCGYGEHGK